MRGGRFTNETAVGAPLSQQVANAATPEHSCNWITSFPLRGAVATRFRISGCFAAHNRLHARQCFGALHLAAKMAVKRARSSVAQSSVDSIRDYARSRGLESVVGAGRSLPIDDEDLIV